jgi:hypothetical protein
MSFKLKKPFVRFEVSQAAQIRRMSCAQLYDPFTMLT